MSFSAGLLNMEEYKFDDVVLLSNTGKNRVAFKYGTVNERLNLN